MTTHPDPERDELASAYLDGEASPAEAAAVEASPDLMARVGELRAVAERLSAPVTPPAAADRERAVAAALAAGDGATAAAAASSLDLARVRRAKPAPRRPRWLPTLAAAAAALVLVVAVGSALVRNGGDGDDDTAATAAGTGEADLEAAPGAGGGGGDASDEGGTAASVPPAASTLMLATLGEDLGTFGDEDALVAAVGARLGEANRTSTTPAAPPTTAAEEGAQAAVPCADVVADDHGATGSLVLAAPATYQDVPVVVLVFEEGSARVIYVADLLTCDLLTVAG